MNSFLFLFTVVASSILPTINGAETFLDVNSYLLFSGERHILNGAERSLGFGFRFCNDKGMLLYQNGGGGFFAVGVNAGRIYLEWKNTNGIIEVRHYNFIFNFQFYFSIRQKFTVKLVNRCNIFTITG